MPKNKTYATPKSTAVFPWITKPDTRFDAAGTYKTGLAFEEDAPFLAELEEIVEAEKVKLRKSGKLTKAKEGRFHMPIKPETTKNAEGEYEETGRLVVTFKSKAQWPDGSPKEMKVFDAKGKAMKGVNVFGGAEIKVAFSASGYSHGANVGVALYMNAVQVINLASKQDTGESFGFGVEEGGYEFKEADAEDESAEDIITTEADDEEF